MCVIADPAPAASLPLLSQKNPPTEPHSPAAIPRRPARPLCTNPHSRRHPKPQRAHPALTTIRVCPSAFCDSLLSRSPPQTAKTDFHSLLQLHVKMRLPGSPPAEINHTATEIFTYRVTPCLKIAISWKPAASLHTCLPEATSTT